MSRLAAIGAVLALSVSSLMIGAAGIGVGDVIEAVMGRLPGGTPAPADGVVWSLRIPRLIGALAVGIGLATAGVAQQAFHRSRLADPYLLGVSAAAGVGAVAATLIGAPVWSAPLAAAVVGAAYTLWLGRLTSIEVQPSRLLLIGLTLGLALTAWTLVVIFIADTPRLPTFTYFIFGSLGTVTWPVLWPTIGLTIGGVVALWRTRDSLDVLALGVVEAHHLGVDVSRVSQRITATVGALTGVTVGLAGVIGFVGLLAPLIILRTTGPSARDRLPAAAVAGMGVVVAADVVARTVGGAVEVPIGVVTAAIGAPVFVTMLVKRSVWS